MASLRVATRGWKHIPLIAELAADAIGPDFAAWLVPDVHSRRSRLVAHLTAYLDHLSPHATMHVLTDQQAAAVWVHRHLPIPPYRPAPAGGVAYARIRVLHRMIERTRPPAPHHDLAVLAVHPTARRAGRGSTLLTHYHHELDQLTMPASVHVADPGTRALLTRHGYRQQTAQRLPAGPPLYLMWRTPR